MYYFKDENNNTYVLDTLGDDNYWVKNIENIHGVTLTEITEDEYNVLINPTLDDVKEQKINDLKATRNQKTDAIVVTLDSGTVLNGDEASQDRMSRAIAVLPDDITAVDWIDYNNATVQLTKPDLQEALQKAGQAQTNIFTTYNDLRSQVNAATTVDDVDAITWPEDTTTS